MVAHSDPLVFDEVVAQVIPVLAIIVFFTTIRGRTLASNSIWLRPWLMWGLLVMIVGEFDTLAALYDGRATRGVENSIVIAAFIWAALTVTGSVLIEHLELATAVSLQIVGSVVVFGALLASHFLNVSLARALSVAALMAIAVAFFANQLTAHRIARRQNREREKIGELDEGIAKLTALLEQLKEELRDRDGNQ